MRVLSDFASERLPRQRRLRAALTLPVIFMMAGCTARNAPVSSNTEARLPGRTVDVKATEFFFDAPATIPAGVTTFRLEQTGLVVERVHAGMQRRELISDQGDNTRGMHMLWVVRLTEGKTINDLQDAARAKQATPWAHDVGGPAFTLPPGTTNATMVLEAGTYALVCYVGSARADVTRYHLLNGMVRTLVVTPSTNSMTLPEANTRARVTAPGVVEFSKPLQAGRQLIRVDNETPEDIEFIFTRKGSWDAAGGLSSVPPGATVLTTVVFEPGDYMVETGFGSKHKPQAITIPGSR